MPAHPLSYEFSSKPRLVKTRSKFRPDSEGGTAETRHDPFSPVNIHHDPRVARGNTFAGDRRSDVPHIASEPKSRTGKKTKKLLGRERSRSSTSSFFETNATQPFISDEIDLSRYLIEAGEGTVRPEQEADTQTDDFEERPQTPDFVPKRTGIDASTQIEESDKLFDLEAEIQPLLAVLVGKTLEQARIEVEREHELECIRQAAATLNRQRADEAQRVLDLKQAVVLAEREKEELRRRRREEAAERRVAKEKVACLQLMRQVLPLSLERALEELIKKSWVTPTDHQIKNEFLPWLYERVAADADKRNCVRDTVDSLLASVDERIETARIRRADTRRREAEDREQATRIARERPIRLFVPAELVGGEEGKRLGPVSVRAGEVVAVAQMRVSEWLAKEGGVEDVTTPDGGFLAGYSREARRRGKGRVGKKSTLLELQEHMGLADEVLLQSSFQP